MVRQNTIYYVPGAGHTWGLPVPSDRHLGAFADRMYDEDEPLRITVILQTTLKQEQSTATAYTGWRTVLGIVYAED